MLDIRIRGFRGAERADVKLAPIALLAGKNRAGKTSMCQAVAAALTGQPIPFFRAAKPDKPALTKTRAKELLRGGMDKGFIEVKAGGDLLAKVEWPSLTATGTGDAACSKIATGLLNPLDFEDAERQKFFSDLLQSEPQIEDILAALKDAELGDTVAKAVLDAINVQGWDPAHRAYKEDGARLKGQWEAHAGTKFGGKKAADWIPDGWRDDLEGRTLEQMGTLCSEAQQAVERALAALAVDAAEREQLGARAKEEEEAERARVKADAAAQAANQAMKAAQAALAKIQVPSAIPCPHCGATVDVVDEERGYALVVSKHTAAEIVQLKAEREKAAKQADGAKKSHEQALEAWRHADAAYAQLKGARLKLSTAGERKGSQEAVDLARDVLSSHQRDKQRVEARARCAELYTTISSNQKVVDILAPEGLRRQKLAKALASFNKDRLAPLCAAAGFDIVSVDQDLDMLYGPRSYFLLSESEKYRVRAVMQTAIAALDGSPVVILDGADVLDSEGRNGLFSMLGAQEGRGFLVGMTMDDAAQAPDLKSVGLGTTYWIDAGIAKEM